MVVVEGFTAAAEMQLMSSTCGFLRFQTGVFLQDTMAFKMPQCGQHWQHHSAKVVNPRAFTQGYGTSPFCSLYGTPLNPSGRWMAISKMLRKNAHDTRQCLKCTGDALSVQFPCGLFPCLTKTSWVRPWSPPPPPRLNMHRGNCITVAFKCHLPNKHTSAFERASIQTLKKAEDEQMSSIVCNLSVHTGWPFAHDNAHKSHFLADAWLNAFRG